MLSAVFWFSVGAICAVSVKPVGKGALSVYRWAKRTWNERHRIRVK